MTTRTKTTKLLRVVTLIASIIAGCVILADIVSTLLRTKTITEQEFLGQQTYLLADGSRVPSQPFRIRSLKVGNIDLLFINVIRIVGTAVPIKSLFRLFAVFAGNVLDEIKIARWSTAIFRWASTFTA